MYIHNKIVFEWDEAKAATNLKKHGIAFVAVYDFDWYNAVLIDKSRDQDNENRYAAIGILNDKLYTVIFTKRDMYTRIISLRRANKAEERIYEKTITTQT